MKSLNLDNVTAVSGGGDFPRVEPGGYICRIVNVADVPEKEYLRVDLDIASGEFKDYYKELCESRGFWGATMYWSYKEKNLPYFKGNIEAVEKSNPGYRFSDASEADLKGKLVGSVFGEEEYKNAFGELKSSVRPRFVCSAQRIMDHDYKIPARKEFKEKDSNYLKMNDRYSPVGKTDLDAWAQGEKLPWDD